MPCVRCGGGTKADWEAIHTAKDGRLISAQKKRKFPLLRRWDTWRVTYCEKHRDEELPIDFREGRVNLKSFLCSIKIKMRRENDGSNSNSD